MGDETLEPVNNIWWIPIIVASGVADDGALIGPRPSSFLVEGNTSEQASATARTFLGYIDNYVPLDAGKRAKLKPFRLSLRGIAEKVRVCDHRFKNRDGAYTCGRPIYSIRGHRDRDDEGFNMNGEHGMCCLEGFDPPEGLNCPYKTKTLEDDLE
ncbi:MAG: hypothetical protein PHF67_00300 [Candidatus Nanoarchaeia archaeon]|nr:hypothetical protein [Candidatus Nanoarchaeia archaeon]